MKSNWQHPLSFLARLGAAQPLAVEPPVLDESQKAIATQIIPLLVGSHRDDAVRLIIRAAEEGVLGKGGDLPQVLNQMFAPPELGQLIAACADFGCPYCDHGLIKCDHCLGRGKVNVYHGCRDCLTLGATPCEFCTGSGLAGYGFFPSGVRLWIAADRIDRAYQRLMHVTEVPIDGLVFRDELVRRYAQLNGLRAIFDNGLQELRLSEDPRLPEVLRLASRAWRGLARSEVESSHSLARLAVAPSRSRGPAAQDDLFEKDRQRILEEEAIRLAAVVRQRVEHTQRRPVKSA